MRDKYKAILQGGPSQEILYDINKYWAFQCQVDNICGEALAERQTQGYIQGHEGDVPSIGAQWDAQKATHQPPDAFD